ncbi:MAG: AAA family ATPase [Gemmatimonadetes bacterium]|nr:AAA family ATPase [Gemmatimonadota bacterium]
MTTDDVLCRLAGVRRSGQDYSARCPAHDDRTASLSVRTAEGRTLLHCHAGCRPEAIVAALGMAMADLFDDPPSVADRMEPRTYNYRDASGEVRYRVCRGAGKRFWQQLPDGRDGWRNGGPADSGRVLYRLRELLRAIEAGEPVVIVEGEKDADNVAALGMAATCNVGGAGKWLPRYADWFRGATVFVLADNDAPGIEHAGTVADSLVGVAADVRQILLPGLPLKGDVSDWLEAGGDKEELARLCKDAPPHQRGGRLPLTGEGSPRSTAEGDDRPAPPRRIRSQVTRLADVKPRDVEWLVPGWIPRGKLTVVEGQPGLGKSTLLIDLVARLTRGESWPGCPSIGPRHALYLSAEDDAADTIRPRLDAAGGNAALVGMLVGGVLTDGDRRMDFDIDLAHLDGLAALEDAIEQEQAGLVVVDVFVAFLGGGVDSYRDQDIRRVMRPLSEVAQRTGAAIVLVRHLRKATGGGAIAAGGGSIGIAGAARSVILVEKDPEDESRRVVASVKMNVAPAPESLSFRVVEAGSVGRVEWLGVSAHTAASLTAARDGGEEVGGTRTEAAILLRSWLAEGPMDRQAVMKLAAESRISQATVDRAARDIRVRKAQTGYGAKNRSMWSLPLPNPITESQSDQVSRYEGTDSTVGIERIGVASAPSLEVEV